MASLPRRGTTPGGVQPRFPGFDVLAEVDAWDPVTAGVVLARIGPMPPLRYFDTEQESVARPMLDLLLDQHTEPRVPVFEMIDQRLAELTTDGWRYEDLPPDPEAWSVSLAAFDQDAVDRHGRGFAQCSREEQGRLFQDFVELGDTDWHGMRAERVWSLWYRYACSAFYSHPWAWNEIGFPGPAYPRGYKNRGINALEPFEITDHHPRDPVAHPAPPLQALEGDS